MNQGVAGGGDRPMGLELDELVEAALPQWRYPGEVVLVDGEVAPTQQGRAKPFTNRLELRRRRCQRPSQF